MAVFDFITRQMELYYFFLNFTLLICIMMLSQENTKMSHNESFKLFFFLVVRSTIFFFIKNKYVNVSTHFVVILNLSRVVLFHYSNTQRKQSWTFYLHCYGQKYMIHRTIQKHAIWLQCDFTQSMLRLQSTK